MKPYDLNESPQKARHDPTPYNLNYRGVTDFEYKKLLRSLYPKDRSKKFIKK